MDLLNLFSCLEWSGEKDRSLLICLHGFAGDKYSSVLRSPALRMPETYRSLLTEEQRDALEPLFDAVDKWNRASIIKNRIYLSYFAEGGMVMMIDTNNMFSMTQANQNFSRVARSVDRRGEAVVLRNNKPKYLIVDMEDNDILFDLTEDEKIDIVAKRILRRYLPAFRELAK